MSKKHTNKPTQITTTKRTKVKMPDITKGSFGIVTPPDNGGNKNKK
jgi:hypothetical protein